MADPPQTPLTHSPPPLDLVLYAPRIAQNTGQISRTCYAMNVGLHLIRPLGFRLDAATLRRSAVGYWDELAPVIHPSLDAFRSTVRDPSRVFLVTKYGTQSYTEIDYRRGDMLVFGNETDGLPSDWLQDPAYPTLKIPMAEPRARCLNVATAASAVLFEALRQLGPITFPKA